MLLTQQGSPGGACLLRITGGLGPGGEHSVVRAAMHAAVLAGQVCALPCYADMPRACIQVGLSKLGIDPDRTRSKLDSSMLYV